MLPSRFSSGLGALALLLDNALAIQNGLALTPQMGWDNWNAFGCSVSEELLLGTANKIVELGLRDLGYHYVVLDDCWSAGRNSSGALQANTTKFPNGMAHVADEIHALGLGFGMYSDAGMYTCGGYAGSLGHETIDAQTFASWGVDYLKYDNCYNEGQSGTPLITYTRYKAMGDALNATGRPILYSLCNWGEDYPWKWGNTLANSWRMSGDIMDDYDRADTRCPCTGDVGEEGYNCALPGFHCSMLNILNKQAWITSEGGIGGWNDMDMLEVGNGGMDDDEYVTHMSMWAALKSPLLMGNDVTAMPANALAIVSNPAVLAISQDPLGETAIRRWRTQVPQKDANGFGEVQMWSGPLYGGDQVVVLLNAADVPMNLSATLADVFYDDGGPRSPEAQAAWDVFDVWGNRMSNATAAAILAGNITAVHGSLNVTNGTSIPMYNVTQLPYAEGLAQNNTLLMGKYVSTVQPLGTINAMVNRHGVAMFRLRQNTSGMKRKRDEL